MAKRVLCDTNVWLDYYLGARSGHEHARMLIVQGCRKDIDFMVPSSCLGDIFYLCQADYKKAIRMACGELSRSQIAAAQICAWASVEHLIDLATVVGSDHGDAHIAMKYRSVHGDFEDDLVLAAALRSHADCLVTGDEKLRRHSPVLTLSVPEALAYFGLEASEPLVGT